MGRILLKKQKSGIGFNRLPRVSLVRGGGIHASVVASIVLVCACSPAPEVEETVLRPVRYQEITSAGGERQRTFSGVAQADVESTLSFRVSGNLRRVRVEVGDSVSQGQRIAELDPTDYRLRLEEAKAALLQAEAQARQAEADYERVQGLYENNNAAKSDLDAGRAAAESARAAIEASKQQVEQARSQLSYTVLRVPQSGYIASVPVEVNENIIAGREIAVLASGSRPEVTLAMPESLIRYCERGDVVSVQFSAFQAEAFPASVTKVGVMATGLATTFPVTVQLDEPTERVRSGMAADVTFTFRAAQGEGIRYLLPPHAVLEDRDGRFVYLVTAPGDGEGTIERRNVEVGEITGDGLEILSGIAKGDRVVTAGVSQISDGLRVSF